MSSHGKAFLIRTPVKICEVILIFDENFEANRCSAESDGGQKRTDRDFCFPAKDKSKLPDFVKVFRTIIFQNCQICKSFFKYHFKKN